MMEDGHSTDDTRQRFTDNLEDFVETEDKVQKTDLISMKYWAFGGISGLAILSASPFLTGYMIAATFAYLCMVGGLLFRTQKKLHVSLMLTAIVTDLTIVLMLEVTREAINTAISLTMTPLQQSHVVTSSIAILFYFPVVILGMLRFLQYRTDKNSRLWHIRCGLTAFFFRTLGFILMFSLLTR